MFSLLLLLVVVSGGCGEVASYSTHTVMLQYNVLMICTCIPVNGRDSCNNNIQ